MTINCRYRTQRKHIIPDLLIEYRKRHQRNPNGVFSRCNIRVVSVNTRWSDKHESIHIILVVRVSLNELRDCTSHEVWFIYLIFLTDGGHWVSENFRHSQAGLVGVFLHRHFLSSFWIWWITRFTVSRILSSLGLLDGVLFLSPNRVLSLGFCWSFFIGFTPVSTGVFRGSRRTHMKVVELYWFDWIRLNQSL